MSAAEENFGPGEYRRLIAWNSRLERERPFLERFLSQRVSERLLDLGCGSGEHAALLSGAGVEVVGVDQSAAQIASAQELCAPDRPHLQFLQASFGELRARLDGSFGGAICLGNVLPFLDESRLESALREWAQLLEPGAPLWIQLLNYAGLRARGVRHLPITSAAGDEPGSELALLRWMRFEDEAHVLFYPTTLLIPAGEAAPTLQRARGVRLRCWSAEALTMELSRAKFTGLELYGGVQFQPYDRIESADLIVCARRRGASL